MRPHLRQPHVLHDVRHRIPQFGGRRQGQIHNPKRHLKPLGRHGAHQLAGPRNLKRRLLNRLRHLIQAGPRQGPQRPIHHARAGNPHRHHTIRLLHPMERPRHKRVVAHRIGEHHQLGAPNRPLILRQLGRPFNNLPHGAHRIHIDAGPGRTNIHRRTHHIRRRQRLRNGRNQPAVTLRHALLHQGGIPTNEIHPHSLRRLIQRVGNQLMLPGSYQRHRGHRNPLIHNGNPQFPLNLLTLRHQVLRPARDRVIHRCAGVLRRRPHAPQQGNPHGDRANIQPILLDHRNGVENIV